MSRLSGFILTLLSILFTSLPAMAGQLVNWNFNAPQNRFTFYTNSRVQPTAQLIPNPTRIVVDLPGTTLSGPTVRQPGGGRVREIRIGEFDAFTTRVVIELQAGYTVDPQQVKVRGITPTQWVVEMPTPELAPTNPTPSNPLPPQSSLPISSPGAINPNVRMTNSGLFVRLDKNGTTSQLDIQSDNQEPTVNFKLGGAVLPRDLVGQTVALQQKGVESVVFGADPNNPTLTLQLAANLGDWRGYYSRVGGGIVLLPRKGFSAIPPASSSSSNATGTSVAGNPGIANPGIAVSQLPAVKNPNLTSITAIDITRDNSQLLVRGDRALTATGTLNRLTGNYEIRINRAQLSPQFKGPELVSGGPIQQLNIRQERPDQVLIIVQPSNNTSFGRLFRSGGILYALELRTTAVARPSVPGSNPDQIPIVVQPPPPNATPSFPPPTTPGYPTQPLPPGNLPQVPRGRYLVVLDPGHGGKDPGAIGLNNVQEKDVILPISRYVAQYLEQQGVKVLMTRTSDYFISLQGRTDMANRAGADLFVSIHANAVGKGRSEVNGFEIYYFGSPALSQIIHRNVMGAVSIGDRGVRQARFYVLRNSRMPATLVETGFVTGYEDNPKLTNPAFQQQMAQAIARGILEYLKRY